MGGVRAVAGLLAAASLGMGCATTHGATAKASNKASHKGSNALSRTSVAAAAGTGGSGMDENRRYVDPLLGFEIMRPAGNWSLDANDDLSPEGLAVPVIMRQKETGAQVVLQIAPAVATPTQFAERLTAGLRERQGFVISDPEPIGVAEGAVGFNFAMGDQVAGKVAVMNGKRGEVFMVMATWPSGSPAFIPDTVDRIIGSLKPLPAVRPNPPPVEASPATSHAPAPAAPIPAPPPTPKPPQLQPMPVGPQYPQNA